MKVGVLVVAYNAESTLRWVLDRIPPELRTDLVEVLVMDDHSADGTFDVAHEYIADGTDIPLTIIRHDHNLGYGGNQKAGYRYAIDHGWDVVVLLHGDGQYAPEKMPDLLAPFADPATSTPCSVRGCSIRVERDVAACRCTSTSATGS